jgi:hypothetical protein
MPAATNGPPAAEDATTSINLLTDYGRRPRVEPGREEFVGLAPSCLAGAGSLPTIALNAARVVTAGAAASGACSRDRQPVRLPTDGLVLPTSRRYG